MTNDMVSFSAKLREHARLRADALAVTCGGEKLTYCQLNRYSNELAHGLSKMGVVQNDLVSIALPNSVHFVAVCHAIWKLGATPQPISFRIPDGELNSIIEIARPRIVIGEQKGRLNPMTSIAQIEASSDSDQELPDAISAVAKAPTSGGSTGRPKVILSGAPGLTPSVTPNGSEFGLRADSVVLLPGPLYHNAPFTMMMIALAYGAHVVLLPKFGAEQTLGSIDRHRVTWTCLVPTMMNRIWRLPDEVKNSYDRSSLRTVWHMAAPCPPWLKEAFIDFIAPAELWELYAGTEGIASTAISGEEWLCHRGSVGRVKKGEMQIVDETGDVLPPGEIGEIYMRPETGGAPTYKYIGAEAKTLPGGWQSLGDMGCFDSDGYLFLADRRTDLILVGGANVYPAEVEAAIEEHPAVESAAVIGLPDDDMGARVHAIVHSSAAISEAELQTYVSSKLISYKVPRSFEFVEYPLRDDAGKLRRARLRESRLSRQSCSGEM